LQRSEQERREAVVAHLAKHFGEEAENLLFYMEKDWSKEKYTKGCPVVILSPGVHVFFFVCLLFFSFYFSYLIYLIK
jgi:monoamine oxidase